MTKPRSEYLWYLASPYSRYHRGLSSAHNLACYNAGVLIRSGIRVFCPIAHTHNIAIAASLDPRDEILWSWMDKPFVEVCDGLIVLTLEGWESSKGVIAEIEAFAKADKPIINMEPGINPFGASP